MEFQAGAQADSAKSGMLNPEDSARYVTMKIDEARLETQLKLLTDLADEHLKRSEAAKSERLESEKWETACSQELRDRAVAVTRQLNEAAKARLAFEEGHLPPITPSVGLGGPGADPNELAYVARLDKRFIAVTAEWLAALEKGRTLVMQLGTNRVPEEVSRIADLLNESTREARELEKEQADLELRKLEFRAIRK